MLLACLVAAQIYDEPVTPLKERGFRVIDAFTLVVLATVLWIVTMYWRAARAVEFSGTTKSDGWLWALLSGSMLGQALSSSSSSPRKLQRPPTPYPRRRSDASELDPDTLLHLSPPPHKSKLPTSSPTGCESFLQGY